MPAALLDLSLQSSPLRMPSTLQLASDVMVHTMDSHLDEPFMTLAGNTLDSVDPAKVRAFVLAQSGLKYELVASVPEEIMAVLTNFTPQEGVAWGFEQWSLQAQGGVPVGCFKTNKHASNFLQHYTLNATLPGQRFARPLILAPCCPFCTESISHCDSPGVPPVLVAIVGVARGTFIHAPCALKVERLALQETSLYGTTRETFTCLSVMSAARTFLTAEGHLPKNYDLILRYFNGVETVLQDEQTTHNRAVTTFETIRAEFAEKLSEWKMKKCV